MCYDAIELSKETPAERKGYENFFCNNSKQYVIIDAIT